MPTACHPYPGHPSACRAVLAVVYCGRSDGGACAVATGDRRGLRTPTIPKRVFVLCLAHACVCVYGRAHVRVHGDLAVLYGAFIQANQALSICPHVQHGDAAVTQLRVTNTRSFSMNFFSHSHHKSVTCLSCSLVVLPRPRLFALVRAPPCRLLRYRMCARSARVTAVRMWVRVS